MPSIKLDPEEELRYIRYALDQSSIVAITDQHGVIEYVNDKFTEISKYSRDELIGKTHRVINSQYHPKEYIQNLWDTILAGKIWRGELRNRAKDGSYYWVDTTITPLLGKDGKPIKFIAIRNDITKRKLLEQQKDEFMAIASHELKTPITSLKGYLQLFARLVATMGDQKMVTMVEKMDRQITKLIVLINDLLDVTRIEAGKLQFHEEAIELNELVKEIAADVQLTADRHTIQVRLDKPVYVTGDRERLGQVLTNLLTNAIKYSPEAEQVVVKTEVRDTEACILVQDSGIGIPTRELDQLFQKFYRSHRVSRKSIPGIGLGLYITAEIVKRHRGKIWADSQEGKGSTFGFSLPLI